MNKRKGFIALLFLLAAVGIFSYNYWSLSCGRCTVSSFYALSTPAVFLLFCNLAALVVLSFFKAKRQRLAKHQSCRCGNLLHRHWSYCPGCGSDRRQISLT